ncbi:MAG TPA: MltA domain-containing protein [Caulobacteraceae bacterium]|nr:MltA domain-containing protein [Caulobacteraceae bacterium]
MGGLRGLPIVALALLAAACVTPRYEPAPAPPPPTRYQPPPWAQPRVTPPEGESIPLAALPGWPAEDHIAALQAFAAGCGVTRNPALAGVCRQARALGPLDEADARAFLERAFTARRVGDEGLLTAYYMPEYEAREAPEPPFTAPVRARPSGLEALRPLGDRAAIEADPPEQALAWMKPEDLFFMQIQGSGLLDLPDGRRLKATFALSNGQPFVPIAPILRERGDLAPAGASGGGVHAWLAAHRGAEADAVMREDPRYVFFNVAADDGREPAGTAGTPLVAGRAIAVDAGLHDLGGAYWIDADAPTLSGAALGYQRLVMALDTGGAIKGAVRADLYLGRGEAAGDEAGRVRHALRLYELMPAAP